MDLLRVYVTWGLILAGAALFLRNSRAFSNIISQLGTTFNSTLTTVQGGNYPYQG
jgi:hypothetical protein